MTFRHLLISPLIALTAATAATAEKRFSLGLERLDLRPADPGTEARLAQWDSPMGRLQYELHQQQAAVMRGSQPGGAGALGLRVKLQAGVGGALVASSHDSGIEIYERSLAVIRWPWHTEEPPAPPIEQQLSQLLGRRLGARPVSGASGRR